jgi:hypothetical protein
MCATAVSLSFWSLAGDIESFQLRFFLVHLVSLFCLLCYLVTQCTAPRRVKPFFPGSIYSPLIMNTEIFSISYERIQVGCWFRVVIPLVLSQTYLHSKLLRAADLLLLRLPLATFQLRKVRCEIWRPEGNLSGYTSQRYIFILHFLTGSGRRQFLM